VRPGLFENRLTYCEIRKVDDDDDDDKESLKFITLQEI
jgi:hypothetical protein